MRLINTETFELEEFMGVVPKYAILSHTWGDGEVSLQDWQRVRQDDRWRTTGHSGSTSWTTAAQMASQLQRPIYHTPPTDNSAFDDALSAFNARGARAGFWKILRACFQARTDDLGYLWVDTNCIDKSSSSELSEAINSMYAWYRNAAVCYAYLVDVPLLGHQTPQTEGSRFRTSRWFNRGWTLQELIAPVDAVFFSSDWVRLGTKSSLTRLLWEITGIQEKYLLKLEGIHGASVAERMSWASNRITTRPEDIAYCLLGIFDVNMPLIYGEGSKAFIRLQEEIIKTSDDHSIFAWTWVPELTDSLMKRSKSMGDLSKVDSYRSLEPQAQQKPTFPTTRLLSLRDDGSWTNPERPTMLAPDPITFYDSRYLPVLAPTDDVAPFIITNAGLAISLPIIEQGRGDLVFAVLHQYQDAGSSKSVLVCVPLAKHYRQKRRYTRTCFPRGPLTIKRDGHLTPHATQSVQICRDVQQVPFYYNAFGGTAHEYGFWFFVPGGWKGYQLAGGFATPGGVFNDYGIFADFPEGSQVAGGLVVFVSGGGADALAILLAWVRGDGGADARQRVLVPCVKAMVVPFSPLLLSPQDLGQRFNEMLADASGRLQPHEPSLRPAKRSHAGNVQVVLHESLPLSHSPLSSIAITEVILPGFQAQKSSTF